MLYTERLLVLPYYAIYWREIIKSLFSWFSACFAQGLNFDSRTWFKFWLPGHYPTPACPGPAFPTWPSSLTSVSVRLAATWINALQQWRQAQLNRILRALEIILSSSLISSLAMLLLLVDVLAVRAVRRAERATEIQWKVARSRECLWNSCWGSASVTSKACRCSKVRGLEWHRTSPEVGWGHVHRFESVHVHAWQCEGGREEEV